MDYFAKAKALKDGVLSVDQYYKELYGSFENLVAEAKNGNATAQANLGTAYSEGVEDFVERDPEKAIGWFNTAIDNGYASPSVFGKLGELLDLKATPQHQRKAYEMYHRAAELGSTDAQLNLAEMYRCGVEGVVNEDLKEAFEWYKKAADESTADDNTEAGVIGRLFAGTMKKLGGALGGARQKALTLLYKYYLEGDCPEGRPQPTKAVYYLNRAAELGDTAAQVKLGTIYLTGSCEQIKDVRKARRWLEKAATSGDVTAKQLIQQCKQSDDKPHDASEVSEEACTQSFGIMGEKLSQRAEANLHPFVVTQPVAYSEGMLSQFDWSPTARIYLKAFKLVKEGLEVLCNSNFTDSRGISLVAQGYLTENSILQAFPEMQSFLLPTIFKLCEENLSNNPPFFEGLLLSFALRDHKLKFSEKSLKGDLKAVMCLTNLIHYIQEAEPNSPPTKDPFEFDKSYSSWLHVLYCHLGALYTIAEVNSKAAEAFENSLKCCPSYYDSKRGLAYNLINLHAVKKEKFEQSVPTKLNDCPPNIQRPSDGEMSKYDSWTTEKLRDTTVRVLQEYLKEAPSCEKNYPNACYYLAQVALLETNMDEFRKYYELGQDAEEKRLPFFEPVDLPLKDLISPFYQLFANVKLSVRCGNEACIKKVKESDLKSCGRCGNQKYCSKDCQRTDWKNHKVSCTSSKRSKK